MAETRNTKNRILFGSCNSQYRSQVLWPAIVSRQANAFVWGGDAIYADLVGGVQMKFPYPETINVETTPERLRELYQQQRQHPGYRQLLETDVPILGVLDDHDYGVNMGDQTYQYKRESAMAFCDFLYPTEHSSSFICRRAKEGLGVYGVKVFDFGRPGQDGTNSNTTKNQKNLFLLSDAEAGIDPDLDGDNGNQQKQHQQRLQLSNQSVAIFLLDVRSHKTPWVKDWLWQLFFGEGAKDGDFLGHHQYEWLKEALRRSTAAVNIIVNGLQVHAENRFIDAGTVVENWSKFPFAQHQLYQAVLQDNVQNPILVSGDIHLAQILKKDCKRHGSNTMNKHQVRSLLEVTTSGMTHSWQGQPNLCARKSKKGYHCNSDFFKFIARSGMHVAHWMNPWRDLVYLSDKSNTDNTHKNDYNHSAGKLQEGKLGLQYTLELNFAELEFDWEQEIISIRVLGTDTNSPPLLSVQLPIQKKTPPISQSTLSSFVNDEDYKTVHQTLLQHTTGANTTLPDDDWFCVSYRGLPSSLSIALGYTTTITYVLFLLLLPFTGPLFLTKIIFRRNKRIMHNGNVKIMQD